MHTSTLRISPGHLKAHYADTIASLGAAGAITKIWNKDASLWKADAAHERVIHNRLGWIPVLDKMQAEAGKIAAFARDVTAAGLTDIVLMGMGGSSLAPEVFSLIFPAPPGKRLFFVLDTTDPEALHEVDRSVDLEHALFVVASKSGKTIETLSQFRYFHKRVGDAGIAAPGEHFIAITDGGSTLDSLAAGNEFRRIFHNPQDIGGRYSALSYFGLVPAALWGVDIAAVLQSALEMRSACAPAAAANPALQLGALLGAAALHGADKLALLASPKLAPLGNWIEQLVAESTGKEGKGIVPIAGGDALPIEVLARGCVNVALLLDGDDDARVKAAIQALEQHGAPVVEIRLSGPAQLGGEFFMWEVATSVAGAVLAIDPFDEPNVQESKDNTGRILQEFEAAGVMPMGTPRVSESGIEVYAEGAWQHAIYAPELSGTLRELFFARRPGDYLALLAYVARDAANTSQLEALRANLAAQLGMPVVLGFGPRYMHSIGQLYKGGPLTGMFMVITAHHAEDLAIPGAKYTFGQLEMAQALGDLQSLAQRGKPALHLHLAQGAAAGLTNLRKIVERTPGLVANRA